MVGFICKNISRKVYKDDENVCASKFLLSLAKSETEESKRDKEEIEFREFFTSLATFSKDMVKRIKK